jgi:hypothetical protein
MHFRELPSTKANDKGLYGQYNTHFFEESSAKYGEGHRDTHNLVVLSA